MIFSSASRSCSSFLEDSCSFALRASNDFFVYSEGLALGAFFFSFPQARSIVSGVPVHIYTGVIKIVKVF
jgi:hypothetical protein